jgi:AcrR family transcriptional regulator
VKRIMFSDEGSKPLSGRQRAVRRATGAVERRSEVRVQRLIDAARELTSDAEHNDFTVAQIAVQSGISLKGFYTYFVGKDELLLALLEEESAAGATMLAEALEAIQDPTDRIGRYVEFVFELASQHPGYAATLVRQHRKLSIEHPAELERAIAPLTELLQVEVANAVRAGVADPCDVARASAIIFGLLVDGLADIAVTGNDARDVTTSLWSFIAGGLRVDMDAPSRGHVR